MNYLLDTHTLIWFFENSRKLSNSVHEKITDKGRVKYLSVVSIWEIAIKMSLKKLKLGCSFEELEKLIELSEIEILPIKSKYMRKLFDLPLIHRDPFDRLIISAAAVEKLTILTLDENIQKYNIAWEW